MPYWTQRCTDCSLCVLCYGYGWPTSDPECYILIYLAQCWSLIVLYTSYVLHLFVAVITAYCLYVYGKAIELYGRPMADRSVVTELHIGFNTGDSRNPTATATTIVARNWRSCSSVQWRVCQHCRPNHI